MRLFLGLLIFFLNFRAAELPLLYSETPDQPTNIETLTQKENGKEASASGELASAEQVKKIEKEIQDVIKVSSMLKTKMQDDRAKIQQIMERTKIHEQIMHNLSRDQVLTPPLTPTIKVEDLLRNEKIRLIAEESRRSHDQLQLIKQRQVTQTVTHNPIKVKSF